MDKKLIENIEQYQKEHLDESSKAHHKNVANVTAKLCDILEYDDKDDIVIIASFHDIGKSMIGLDVLSKNGPLTKSEWEIVKMHPIWGKDIVEELGMPIEYSIIISQHHERAEGNGYPLGIEHDEIHFGAAIIAVADVFDALLEKRPYKEAWSNEKVKSHFIKNLEGFNKIVTNALLDNFDNVVKARKE